MERTEVARWACDCEASLEERMTGSMRVVKCRNKKGGGAWDRQIEAELQRE